MACLTIQGAGRSCLALVLLLSIVVAAPAGQDADWRTYLGDRGRRHYSPLDQITRENVHRLEPAWRYDSGALRDGVSLMYTSPLIVGYGAENYGGPVIAAGGGRIGPPSSAEYVAFALPLGAVPPSPRTGRTR